MSIEHRQQIETATAEVQRVIALFGEFQPNSTNHVVAIANLLAHLVSSFLELFEHERAAMQYMEMPQGQREQHFERHGIITKTLSNISKDYRLSRNTLECKSEIAGLGETFCIHRETYDSELLDHLS